ncbi:DUF885 domain-containing protein [Bowmanella dokdonensis]|uniref:DUF885 domain-containing protein n=1 Tax=Bowmanella dokdonensis TaxID=751969 RepID=UPI0030B9CB93
MTIKNPFPVSVFLSLLLALALPVSAAAQSADNALAKIIEDHWQYSLAEDPITASRMGEAGFSDRLPAVADKDRARRLAAEKQFLKRLENIQVKELSDDNQVNHAMLRWVLKNSIEANELYLDRIPVNTFYAFWNTALNASKGLSMNTVADYEDYISRIQDFGRYVDQHLANMRVGIQDRFVLPKIVVKGIAPTVRALASNTPEQSSLYEPFANLPASFSASERERLVKEGTAAIRDVALPALDRVATFLEGEYMTAASDTLGAEQLPGGKAYYRHAIRTYVTQDMTADEIHSLGLSEVKRIRSEMDSLIEKSGFEGDFKAFTEFLRTDPQFYATSAEQLLKEAAYIAKRTDYRLPEFFGKLPRQPYGIVPVPDEIAPNYTTASYNPAPVGGTRGGAYWLNTYALDQRPLYELVALSLHEGVPGHHLQSALSKELENVPHFRRTLYLSAFGEGWGLYSERLGVEMGLYDTPYQHFGRLSYEMWRACRLVIDTGIHSQGWSRQQALDFLADNTSLSQANVRAEVDRYISWPGQALSYKMGEIKIRQLRARAEEALGKDFDIREFHDTLLGNGALPLELLDAQIQAYIENHKSGAE